MNTKGWFSLFKFYYVKPDIHRLPYIANCYTCIKHKIVKIVHKNNIICISLFVSFYFYTERKKTDDYNLATYLQLEISHLQPETFEDNKVIPLAVNTLRTNIAIAKRKWTNNELQHITQKTTDQATWTH